jgi:hypothetical protein
LSQTLILLVGMEGILGEIIKETLACEPDLRIIGEAADVDQLVPRELALADVVVACLAEESSLRRPWSDLVLERGRSRLLLILDDGRRAAVYDREGRESPLDALSPSGLVQTIRGLAPLAVDRG